MRRAGIAIVAIGLCAAALDTGPAAAQSTRGDDAVPTRHVQVRRTPTRIEVHPTRRLYRQCVAWLAPEERPSGPVITPQMRCRWAFR